MKLILVSLVMALSGCSTHPQVWKQIAANALGNATDQTISYNASRCVSIRQHCPTHLYSEWQQENGQVACSCDRAVD